MYYGSRSESTTDYGYISFKPPVYLCKQFVYQPETREYEKQDYAQKDSNSECLSYRAHDLSPYYLIAEKVG